MSGLVALTVILLTFPSIMAVTFVSYLLVREWVRVTRSVTDQNTHLHNRIVSHKAGYAYLPQPEAAVPSVDPHAGQELWRDDTGLIEEWVTPDDRLAE